MASRVSSGPVLYSSYNSQQFSCQNNFHCQKKPMNCIDLVRQLDYRSNSERRKIIIEGLTELGVDYRTQEYPTGVNLKVDLGSGDKRIGISSHLTEFRRRRVPMITPRQLLFACIQSKSFGEKKIRRPGFGPARPSTADSNSAT
jgi:hypothetical protein